MIKVASLTSGKFDPSSRLRVRQHIKSLKASGIEVVEFIPLIDKYAPLPFLPKNCSLPYYAVPLPQLWQVIKLCTRIPGILGSLKSHITWLLRDLLPGCLTLEPFLKKPLVFDIDDAIWLNRLFGPNPAVSIAKRADVVIAGNAYIADRLGGLARSIHIVPTAVDTEKFKPPPLAPRETTGRFTVGWIGTASNLNYLLSIEKPLAAFLSDRHDTELLVVSNDVPRFRVLSADRVHYIPWSEENEVNALKRIDTGIMPLPDNDSTRGKCSYKMLLYMSCGIPVVVSPVGMNLEVLGKGASGLVAQRDADSYEAFSSLYEAKGSAEAYGQTGRRVVETYYSQKKISREIADIFKGLR